MNGADSSGLASPSGGAISLPTGGTVVVEYCQFLRNRGCQPFSNFHCMPLPLSLLPPPPPPLPPPLLWSLLPLPAPLLEQWLVCMQLPRHSCCHSWPVAALQACLRCDLHGGVGGPADAADRQHLREQPRDRRDHSGRHWPRMYLKHNAFHGLAPARSCTPPGPLNHAGSRQSWPPMFAKH